MKAIFSRRNNHNNHNNHAHGTRRYSEGSRASASSSSDVTPTPHLLAGPAAASAAALLPPLTSHSGHGRRHSLTKHHSHDFHHSTPPPHPPRPSPDSTISTRKSHASTHISASEQTHIQSNLQSDALIRAREHDLRKRQQEWKDGPLSLPCYMMSAAGGGAGGGSTESSSQRTDGSGSEYDSDTALSELTALLVQTNEDDVRASLVLPRDVKKKKQKQKQKQKQQQRQGKKSKESKDDIKSDKPIKQKQKKMKPKSIFRSKLKYTKQVNDAITRRLSSRSNHSAQSDTSTMAAVIVSATSSKASSCSKDASYTGVAGTNNNNNNNEWNGTATSAMAPYYPYQANPASPKTPKTVASLDYSSSDGDNTPKSIDDVVDDDDALSSPLFPTPTPADDDTNSSDVNEVFQNLSTPTSPVLLPALQAHSQGKGNCFQPPSPPCRTASIVSQHSSSKDTYSTLSTRSWTTNLSTQSAPEARMLETLTEAKRVNQSSISRFKTNRRLRDSGYGVAGTRGGSHHRKAKSAGADMDELFAAVIKITDEPRYDIEDMLSIRHNSSMVSDTSSRAGRSVATSTKSLPNDILRSTKGSGDDAGVDSQMSRARQLLQKRRELTNSISGMRLVKQDEERKNAAALNIPQTSNNKNKPLGPRFRTQSGNEIAPPSQSPPQPPRPRHSRKPSREEVILSAPHMPVLIRPPSSSPAQSRKNSLDTSQQQSQSSLDEIERELEIERERLSPHVMFPDERQGRLCSFCSHHNSRSGNVTPHSEMAVYHSESFDLEENEERLDSEIYQTFLEMAQFDVRVTELNDYDSFISSISSERSSQADG